MKKLDVVGLGSFFCVFEEGGRSGVIDGNNHDELVGLVYTP